MISDFRDLRNPRELLLLTKHKGFSLLNDRQFFNEWYGTGDLVGWGEDDELTEFNYTITGNRVTAYVLGERYDQSDPLELFYTGARVEDLSTEEIFSLIAATVC